MRRRTLLKSIAASSVASSVALAGCMESAPTGERATVELVSVTGLDESLPLAFNVEVIEDTFIGRGSNDTQPAALRLSLINKDDVQREILTGHREVFSATHSEDGRYALVGGSALRRAREDGDIIEDNCWKLNTDVRHHDVMRVTRVPAGGEKFIELGLFTARDAEGCLPEGTFTFSHTYQDTESDAEVSVSFDLRVTRTD